MTNLQNEYIEIIEDRLENSKKSQEWLCDNNIIKFDKGVTVTQVLNKIASKWNNLTDESKQEISLNIGGRYNLASTLTFFNTYNK